MRGFCTAISLAVLSVVLSAFSVGGYDFAAALAQERPPDFLAMQPQINHGQFSLIDHNGRSITDKDFLGKFMLVFFGYTHCPDVCPTDLQTMGNVLDILGTAGEKVQPIFITIDPERDTADVMAEYVSFFHPRLTGLTGTVEQVAAAAKVYGVRSMKFYPMMLDEDGAANDNANGAEQVSDYVLDHSAAMYLVGPDGGGISLYPHGMLVEQIVEDIRQFVDRPQ